MLSPLQILSSRVRQLLQRWQSIRWYHRMRRFYTQFIKPGDLAIHEQFKWRLDKWVTPDEMIRILEQNRNNPAIISGDVYVRLES